MENENHRYCIEIAFNGTNYHGWQIQENAITVQGQVEAALSTVIRQVVKTVGCGRTDTGVHAKQLFAHFDCSTKFSESEVKALVRSLNSILPRDIAIKDVFYVDPNFHARFHAVSRSYEYNIHFQKNPFLTNLSWQVKEIPDINAMNKAAEIMMEYTDFSCFSKSHTQTHTNNCEIYNAEWRWLGSDRLIFNITANRFLRNMVRAIVGTLLEIGSGHTSVESIRSTIESRSRSEAGTSVPACGLFLTRVQYPEINKE